MKTDLMQLAVKQRGSNLNLERDLSLEGIEIQPGQMSQVALVAWPPFPSWTAYSQQYELTL